MHDYDFIKYHKAIDQIATASAALREASYLLKGSMYGTEDGADMTEIFNRIEELRDEVNELKGMLVMLDLREDKF